jgi:hypothetical protein
LGYTLQKERGVATAAAAAASSMERQQSPWSLLHQVKPGLGE